MKTSKAGEIIPRQGERLSSILRSMELVEVVPLQDNPDISDKPGDYIVKICIPPANNEDDQVKPNPSNTPGQTRRKKVKKAIPLSRPTQTDDEFELLLDLPEPSANILIQEDACSRLLGDIKLMVYSKDGLLIRCWHFGNKPVAVLYDSAKIDEVRIPFLYLPIPPAEMSWVFHTVNLETVKQCPNIIVPELNLYFSVEQFKECQTKAQQQNLAVQVDFIVNPVTLCDNNIIQMNIAQSVRGYLFREIPELILFGPIWNKTLLQFRKTWISYRSDAEICSPKQLRSQKESDTQPIQQDKH